MSGSSDGGYSIFVDPVDLDSLNTLMKQGKLILADIRSPKANMAGQSFTVMKGRTVSFTVEIKDGYEKGDDFQVSVLTQSGRDGRKPVLGESVVGELNIGKPITVSLSADAKGKYTFKADADTTINIKGVQLIEATPTPEISYVETNAGITFTATGEGEVTLYVNGKAVENGYTLTHDELEKNDGVFSVYATAKASNKRISEPATLDGNSSGIDVVVPVTIEDSAHGSVKVAEKYGAPGTEAKLTVTPESG